MKKFFKRPSSPKEEKGKKVGQLTQPELKELKKRTEMISENIYIAQSLEAMKNAYTMNLLKKNNLDERKQYNIDFETGMIYLLPAPQPPQPPQPAQPKPELKQPEPKKNA